MYLNSIISKCNCSTNRTLNVITCSTHERYETGLCKTNQNFYSVSGEGIKDWHVKYAPIPPNYIILDKKLGFDQIPKHVDFDLALSQNQAGQFPVLAEIANKMGLPLVTLCHTMPYPNWSKRDIEQLSTMYGQVNVFISEYSKKAWEDLCGPITNAIVIDHMVDTEVFSYRGKGRHPVILTVANDYINRNYCLNFSQYMKVTEGLPTHPVGDTKDFSEKAKSTEHLVEFYNSAKIFLNTAHVSPIPMSVLEAMACGSVVVSCNTCAIPEYIDHGVNGFLADSDEEMREILETLLKTPEDALLPIRLAAVKTIQEKCSPDKFVSKWNNLFRKVVNAS